MKVIYGLLLFVLGISVSCIYIAYDFTSQLQLYNFGSDTLKITLWKDLLFNIGSGLTGSIFLLFVFEGVRDYRDNKEKKAKKSIAVNKLDEYIKLYLSAAYCSLNGKTKKLNVHRMNASQIKQIVNESFFEEFKSVDLLKAVHHQELNGLQFIGHQIDRLQNDKQVLNIYELYLPAELVMLIEQVIN